MAAYRVLLCDKTADDERIEREAMLARFFVAATFEWLLYERWVNGRPELVAWGEAQQQHRPLPDLRALEGAYRAAVDQG